MASVALLGSSAPSGTPHSVTVSLPHEYNEFFQGLCNLAPLFTTVRRLTLNSSTTHAFL